MASEHWKNEPEDHDFPAAQHYLHLLFTPNQAGKIVEQLRVASTVTYAAKDLLRASELELLGRDNAHVQSDLEKVARGERLSPVLLVRGDQTRGLALVIADGYHRVCASYWLDENNLIPARIVKRPKAAP
ncbi:MAG TPA: hypothetical protein PLG60_01315 [Acidimicrobiales bacterium]|nr:hypothetical protein [Acidimicrobiales bacterium]